MTRDLAARIVAAAAGTISAAYGPATRRKAARMAAAVLRELATHPHPVDLHALANEVEAQSNRHHGQEVTP